MSAEQSYGIQRQFMPQNTSRYDSISRNSNYAAAVLLERPYDHFSHNWLDWITGHSLLAEEALEASVRLVLGCNFLQGQVLYCPAW